MKCDRRKKKNKSGKGFFLKGSYTVEASFLLPMFFFLILYLLYMSFFLYNQCVIVQGSYRTALSIQRLPGKEEERLLYGEEKYKEVVTKRLAGISSLDKKIIFQGQDVEVITKGNMQVPVKFLFLGSWNLVQKQSAEKMEPVSFIRNCRKAERILKGITEEK